MVKFENLKQLSMDMRKHTMSSAQFSINYNGHFFSCVYIDEIEHPLLLVTTLGRNPFTIKILGNKTFEFNVYLGDRYRDLIRYLELQYDPNNKFLPEKFFSEFDKKIPISHALTNKPSPSEMARTVNNTIETADEADKIYFCKWKNLPFGQKVSEANFYKTCALIGYEDALRLRDNGISSCWTDDPNEERIMKIAQYPR